MDADRAEAPSLAGPFALVAAMGVAVVLDLARCWANELFVAAALGSAMLTGALTAWALRRLPRRPLAPLFTWTFLATLFAAGAYASIWAGILSGGKYTPLPFTFVVGAACAMPLLPAVLAATHASAPRARSRSLLHAADRRRAWIAASIVIALFAAGVRAIGESAQRPMQVTRVAVLAAIALASALLVYDVILCSRMQRLARAVDEGVAIPVDVGIGRDRRNEREGYRASPLLCGGDPNAASESLRRSTIGWASMALVVVALSIR